MTEVRRAGVLGRPITHSLSPVVHRAAYTELGLDWTYDAIDCGVEDLAGVLAERADWAGFSATMPLKHALLEIAATIAPIAAEVGAANTLLPGPAGWIADNTDVAGIVAALAEQQVAPESVTIVGAGGTAQAMLAAMRAIGVSDCTALVRNRSRAGALLATAERLRIGVTLGDLDIDSAALGARLVVSTLPPGAADPLAGHAWSRAQAVLDVCYRPWPTPLAAAAAAASATVVSGALLLLHQAAEQVRLMTGKEPPVGAMRRALQQSTPGCGV